MTKAKKVLKRRRREFKTDYLKRLKLLKSEKPRLVFRKTNKYLEAQYVLSEDAQDKVLFGITSKELLKYGMPKEASLKSIPSSYLFGILFGKFIKKKKLKKPILDFGMLRILHKSKIYGFLKGLLDSGIEIKCEEKFFPETERISGKDLKIKIPFEKIKKEVFQYEK